MKKKNTKSHPSISNRKTERKLKRQEKKVKRKEHYVKKNTLIKNEFIPGRFVKRPAETVEDEPPMKKKKQLAKLPSLHDILIRERQKDIKETNKLKNQMDEQRQKMLTEANEDEDKVIKKLEKQLGLNKTKNKNNFFADDGLDYLLEICDRTTGEQIVAAEKHLANVEDESDFEDDLAEVTGKDAKSKKMSKKDSKKNKEAPPDINESDENSDEVDDDDDDEDSNLRDGDVSVDDEESEDDGGDEDLSDDDFGLGEDSEELSDHEEPVEKKPSKTVIKSKEVPKNKNPSQPEPESDGEIENPFSDDEVSHLSDDDDDVNGNDEHGEDVKNDDDKKEKPDVWEDIYGRKRDKEGNVLKQEKGAYLPPHLRDKAGSAEQALIDRQIKSVLNKLSQSNLHWACGAVERAHAAHSRHAVRAALARQWLAACGVTGAAGAGAGARLLADHAALLACLHANVASELGAHFLQEMCSLLDRLLRAPPDDKRLENLLAALAHLYNFKIFSTDLMYDILRRVLASLTEGRVSAALAALSAAAAALRRADPPALRAFVQETQARCRPLADDAGHGTRIKFLLDVLMAIKNNNLTKIPNYDPSYSEQMQKTIKTVIRPGNYVTTLNIRLDDLLNAEERGKWWIVGSAWDGAAPAATGATEATGTTGGAGGTGTPTADARLLELARQQRMNTDVRRAVFCVIMGAEDYTDAFAKLHQLGLRAGQQREVVHVLLACCGNERSYNPYYGLLAARLARSERTYALSLQFALWDRLRALQAAGAREAARLARLVADLVAGGALALSVLKVIEFSDLNKSAVKFMRQVLLAIIMNDDVQTTLQVFHRISKAPKLHMFRESLRLFIQHFLLRNAGKKASVLSDSEMEVLRQRTHEIDKILTMHESKLKF